MSGQGTSRPGTSRPGTSRHRPYQRRTRPRAGLLATKGSNVATVRALVDANRALLSDGATARALGERPRTRGDCVDGPRPCPWQGCRYHLALDVTPCGSIRIVAPDVDLVDAPDTCALDVADRGDATLEYIAERLNLTRERVRQIEAIALRKLGRSASRLR